MLSPKAFATTVNYYQEHPSFAESAHILDVPATMELSHDFVLRDELIFLLRILRAALSFNVLLLFCHRGRLVPELMAAVLIGLWPKQLRPAIIFHGEMYEPNQGFRHTFERLLMRLADRAIVRYIVYSEAEIETFSEAWGLAPSKVRFAYHPFYGNRKREQAPFVQPSTAPHIFAGGNSFRDYDPLIEATRLLPETHFVICTSELADRKDLPANVRAESVSSQEFSRLMRTAGAVVIPIRKDTHRIAGALTYLQSMWLRKPTIVSDALGAREYIEDGVTGWVVDGCPESYAQAIRLITDTNNQSDVQRVCDNAHTEVDVRFSMDTHVKTLLEIVAEVVDEQNEQICLVNAPTRAVAPTPRPASGRSRLA